MGCRGFVVHEYISSCTLERSSKIGTLKFHHLYNINGNELEIRRSRVKLVAFEIDGERNSFLHYTVAVVCFLHVSRVTWRFLWLTVETAVNVKQC